jgi:hypothetical protein
LIVAGVRGDLALTIDLTQVGSNDLGSPKMRVSISKALSFLEGTDAVNKADLLFSDTRTITASGTDSLDLAGSLSGAFGATLTAAEIVVIFISAHAGNTNNVTVSRPASNGFIGPFLATSDGLAIKPGEWAVFVSETGWAVTAATGDLLALANSGAGTGVDYDIVIVGRTVAA